MGSAHSLSRICSTYAVPHSKRTLGVVCCQIAAKSRACPACAVLSSHARLQEHVAGGNIQFRLIRVRRTAMEASAREAILVVARFPYPSEAVKETLASCQPLEEDTDIQLLACPKQIPH